MGFKSVYRSLQEIFPEVDARLLRAVAIENSKDADAAVNDVLNEVLPQMADQSIDRNRSAERKSFPAIDKKLPNGIPYERSENLLPRLMVVEAAFAEPSSRSGFSIGESSKDFSFRLRNDACLLDVVDNTGGSSELGCDDAGKNLTINSIRNVLISDHQDLDKGDNTGSSLEPNHPDVGIHMTVDSATTDDEPQLWSHSEEGNGHLSTENLDEELIVLKGRCEQKNDMDCIQTVNAMSNCLEKKGANDQVNINTDESEVSCYRIHGVIDQVTNGEVGFTGRLDEPENDSKEVDCNIVDCFVASEQSFNVDCTFSEPSNIVTEMALPALVEIADSTVGHKANEYVASDQQSFNTNISLLDSSDIGSEPVPPVSIKTANAKEFELQSDGGTFYHSATNDDSFIEVSSNDNAFARNSKQSGQICSTEFLDEIIEDAKNNKKNLFSVMESVMKLIKEVQLQERAAEVAKEEAAMGGIDILVKVEEMKQMLAHAKEANDMHAGEVYGEKSILAAEARELQSRLLSLSDERDKSLSTLDEMRQTLESRLSAAKEVKRAAELEKLEKEKSAQEALAEQETIMEKVVQESKLLERQAEENSKLQEFLVGRGRMLDVLQGEISVICEDVRLLKVNFDKRIPLSMSVSSSQTTCKLASSASSLKSTTSDKAPEEPESLCNSPVEGTSSVSTVEKLSTEEDSVQHNDKVIEDEWEIFDKEEEELRT